MEMALQTIDTRLDRIERLTLISAKAVLDIDEASLFTGFSKGHLYRLTSERHIPHYKKNRKLYFKKSELETWLLEDKVMTAEDIESQAETYVVTHK